MCKIVNLQKNKTETKENKIKLGKLHKKEAGFFWIKWYNHLRKASLSLKTDYEISSFFIYFVISFNRWTAFRSGQGSDVPEI